MPTKKALCFAEIMQRQVLKAGGQSELEERTLIAQQTISDYAKGNTLPSTRRVKMICRALDLDVKYVQKIVDADRKLFSSRDKRKKLSPLKELAAKAAKIIEKEKASA